MPTYDACKNLGRNIVLSLVRRGTPCHLSVLGLHQELTRLGLVLRENQVFGMQPDGRQLLYTLHEFSGQHDYTVLVRVKTRGNARPPREGVAHMSVSLVQGGLGWDRERAKLNGHGQVASKLTTDGTKPPPPYTFPTLIVTDLTPAGQDAWANRCHFDFAPGFDITGAASLVPQPLSV